MRRAVIPALSLAVAAAAGACTGSADTPSTAKPPSPSVTISATPSTTPPPSVPVMPEVAKAHTKAGAKAFVEHFWRIVDYVGTTLQPGPLEGLTADGCSGCAGALQFVRDMRSAGAHFSGSHSEVGNFHVTAMTLSGQARIELTFDVATPEQIADYPGTERDEKYPAGTRRARFMVKPVPGGWRVVLWESA